MDNITVFLSQEQRERREREERERRERERERERPCVSTVEVTERVCERECLRARESTRATGRGWASTTTILAQQKATQREGVCVSASV